MNPIGKVEPPADPPTESEAPIERLDPRGRSWRALVTAAVVTALVAGSLWGSDDHFPFGPFKMYSTARELSGTVNVPKFQVVTEDGDVTYLGFERFGLRRAEVEGQFPRFVRDPDLLEHLVVAHERFYPDAPTLVEVRLINFYYQLEDGRPVDEYQTTLAVWRRS